MAGWLLDTNVLLRMADTSDIRYKTATGAVTTVVSRGEPCFVAAQIIIEFWSVATRPLDANGLGWSVAQVRQHVDALLDQFLLLEDGPGLFTRWLQLTEAFGVRGKRVHDIRLLALMLEHGLTQLLTFNVQDFPAGTGVNIIDPSSLI